MNGRMCIVSRRSLPAEALIRFVVAPDGSLVPDLRRRLPGRGAHVEARREVVETAVRKGLFRRAFKGAGIVEAGLADTVDALLAKSALGALGLARKAGQLATGGAKVEAEVRSGRALALLQARDGAPDGLRKMEGARHAALRDGRARQMPLFRPFVSDELGLALGGVNVIHAAVLAGNAGAALLRRLEALEFYRGESPDATIMDSERAEGGVPGRDGRSEAFLGQEAEA
nr:RNA-binding protein [Aureimonas populi]